ncbi:hypothetical protein [Pedobacter cryotolerans]|uniref:DUF3945 domain-containing protein n=1 Tax=Pedobacter cryotolerans TaxID=2571270 RepID=A0A4U1C472_9SPHI|nr:hypothetical protein [Pedobacter cryotolerans]TKC00047.1 hypothetical protein FA045_11450 [Pedobacter cryotolerans]
MTQLIKDLEMASGLIEYLEQEKAQSRQWVVYDTDNPITSKYDLHCFTDESEAIDFAKEYQQIWNWHEAVPIGTMIYDLKELDKLQSKEIDLNNNKETSLKTIKDMNLNNLENLRDEMKKLGFSTPLIAKMEEHMKNDDPTFKLYDQVKANRGQVDITLHFKQSGQSDYYYLNRLEAVHNQSKPLEEGQKYMVITKTDEGKNIVKKLENVAEAIDFFKKQSGNSQLAVGKDAANKSMLANMEEGKVNYVAKDFNREFYSPPLPQTFWLDHGKGFTKEQAANLVQGRAVYRDDLLSREGNPYKAWMQLDTEKERDRQNNLTFRQFTNAYGYDVKALLDDYKIKEMADPKKAEALETALINGNRPLVTVEKDGQETKMYLETAVRYGKLNFYAENGKPEKREQFQKETGLEMSNTFTKKMEQSKDKEVAQGQGMGV